MLPSPLYGIMIVNPAKSVVIDSHERADYYFASSPEKQFIVGGPMLLASLLGDYHNGVPVIDNRHRPTY